MHACNTTFIFTTNHENNIEHFFISLSTKKVKKKASLPIQTKTFRCMYTLYRLPYFIKYSFMYLLLLCIREGGNEMFKLDKNSVIIADTQNTHTHFYNFLGKKKVEKEIILLT